MTRFKPWTFFLSLFSETINSVQDLVENQFHLLLQRGTSYTILFQEQFKPIMNKIDSTIFESQELFDTSISAKKNSKVAALLSLSPDGSKSFRLSLTYQ